MDKRPFHHRFSNPKDAFESPTFGLNARIPVNQTAGAASISPCGRDIALASREGLHIVDLDNLHVRPRHLVHRSPWDVADVQWSPFASRYYWIVSTSNQKALVWNLEMKTNRAPIQFTLHAHSRAITDINFSAHHPDILSTCAVDSYVHCWDLRIPAKPAFTFADWHAGATQVKWNRQEPHIVASAHDRFLHIWDDRKGTFPLKSIEAHQTKIYGIDWSRETANGIVTCSLDHTVKIWRHDKEVLEPDRVIHTDYPVWRARHTPFGQGVLVMPQRGTAPLQLFRQNECPDEPGDGVHVAPAVTFRGHKDQVKEFLWRPRGCVENGIDNREFQLVSLGLDHQLILHRITDEQLAKVGYVRGMAAVQSLKFTRRGALYRTFCGTDGPVRPIGDAPRVWTEPTCVLNGTASGSAPVLVPSCTMVEAALSGPGREAAPKLHRASSETNGVASKKITELMVSKASGTTLPSFAFSPSVLLRDEIEGVRRKFREVLFNKTNYRKRAITFTLLCRWDRTHKPALMKVKIRFPISYPRVKGPDFVFQKLPAAMSNAALVKLHRDLDTIAEHHRCRRVGSLEAAIFFLLGKRTLTESISKPSHKPCPIEGYYGDGSCSDGDFDRSDPTSSRSRTRLSGGRRGGARRAPTIDPPPPKTCGARWTPDGQLACFFVRHQGPDAGSGSKWAESANPHPWDPRAVLSDFSIGIPGNAGAGDELDGDGDDDDDDDSDSDDSTCHSSADSSDIDDLVNVNTKLFLLSPWRSDPTRAGMRCDKTGQLISDCPELGHTHHHHQPGERGHSGHHGSSHGSHGSGKPRPQNISVLWMYPVPKLIPGSRALAEDYLIFGDSSMVCKHNSRVALEHGFVDVAASWNLADLVIQSQIPLEWLYGFGGAHADVNGVAGDGTGQHQHQQQHKHHFGVGYDLRPDRQPEHGPEPGGCGPGAAGPGPGPDTAPYTVLNLGAIEFGPSSALSLGRMSLEGHLLNRPWVLDQLFDHYERMADVQMLAMLSCVFIGSNFPVHRDVIAGGMGLTVGKGGIVGGVGAAGVVAVVGNSPFGPSARQPERVGAAGGSGGSGVADANPGPGSASGLGAKVQSPAGSTTGGAESPSPARFLTPSRSLAPVSTSRLHVVAGQVETGAASGASDRGDGGLSATTNSPAAGIPKPGERNETPGGRLKYARCGTSTSGIPLPGSETTSPVGPVGLSSMPSVTSLSQRVSSRELGPAGGEGRAPGSGTGSGRGSGTKTDGPQPQPQRSSSSTSAASGSSASATTGPGGHPSRAVAGGSSTRLSTGNVTWGGVQVFGDSDSSSAAAAVAATAGATAMGTRAPFLRKRAPRPSIITRDGGGDGGGCGSRGLCASSHARAGAGATRGTGRGAKLGVDGESGGVKDGGANGGGADVGAGGRDRERDRDRDRGLSARTGTAGIGIGRAGSNAMMGLAAMPTVGITTVTAMAATGPAAKAGSSSSTVSSASGPALATGSASLGPLQMAAKAPSVASSVLSTAAGVSSRGSLGSSAGSRVLAGLSGGAAGAGVGSATGGGGGGSGSGPGSDGASARGGTRPELASRSASGSLSRITTLGLSPGLSRVPSSASSSQAQAGSVAATATTTATGSGPQSRDRGAHSPHPSATPPVVVTPPPSSAAHSFRVGKKGAMSPTVGAAPSRADKPSRPTTAAAAAVPPPTTSSSSISVSVSSDRPDRDRDRDRDRERDRGPARPARAQVTLKNQERFDNGGFCGTSLVDPPVFRRAFAYRDLYGSMLEAWGLGRAAAEVLCFNEPRFGGASGGASGIGGGSPSTGDGEGSGGGAGGVGGAGGAGAGGDGNDLFGPGKKPFGGAGRAGGDGTAGIPLRPPSSVFAITAPGQRRRRRGGPVGPNGRVEALSKGGPRSGS